jgi:hypothetical protein
MIQQESGLQVIRDVNQLIKYFSIKWIIYKNIKNIKRTNPLE